MDLRNLFNAPQSNNVSRINAGNGGNHHQNTEGKKENMKTNWESIQNNWVNGNRKDARRQFLSNTKLGMVFIMLDAIESDSINDLVEILESVVRDIVE